MSPRGGYPIAQRALLASLAQDSHSRGGEGSEDLAEGQPLTTKSTRAERDVQTAGQPCFRSPCLSRAPRGRGGAGQGRAGQGRVPILQSRKLSSQRGQDCQRSHSWRVATLGLGHGQGRRGVGSIPGPRYILPKHPPAHPFLLQGCPGLGCWLGGRHQDKLTGAGAGAGPESGRADRGSLEDRGAHVMGNPG